MSTLAQYTRRLASDQSILTMLVAENPTAVRNFLKSLTDLEALLFDYGWEYKRRPAQTPPEGDWEVWMILGGRGMGKTRPGAEQIVAWAKELGRDYGSMGKIALIGKDPRDLRQVMIEGESGILACSPPWFRPLWEPSKQQITWPNGVIAQTFSAEVPDDLRGPQFHKGWCDELPKWRFPQETWDMYQMAVRLGINPQTVITTTPRPIKTLMEIMEDPGTAITRGTTDDNYVNLSSKFLRTVYRKYKGTRLGRQELSAELLTDTPGALWTLDMIDACRVREVPCPLTKIVIAIDPPSMDPDPTLTDEDQKNAECGMMAVGQGADTHTYILHDLSGHLSADEWGSKAIAHGHALSAEEIIGEANNGGDMVGFVVKAASEKLGIPFAYRKVWASRGKRTRAEPVSAKYEQQRCHHVGTFSELEDQMTTWVPGMKSPDRMDALVWGVTAVAFDEREVGQTRATW